jgi:lipopolysaccharide export system protein LptA
MTQAIRHSVDGHTRARRFVAGVLLMVAASVPAAHAERADRAKPVNIEADRLSLDDLKKESVFEGNVTLTQGSLMLRADRVVVRQDEQGFNYAFATGDPAYFRQKREGFDEYIEGYAQRLEYDGKQDKVEMFTNARVKKGIDEVRGDYISYNAVTEFYEVVGGGKNAATPSNPQGRVRAVIQPKRDMQKPAGPGKPGSPQAAAEGTTLRPAATLRNPPQQ